MRLKKSALLIIFFSVYSAFSQNKPIDRIVAVIGKNIVLQSDVESQYSQYIGQGNPADPELKCQMLDQIMLHKLMVNQADLDSVTVPEGQVDSELDRRVRFFVSQIGSEKKLEEYYKKSIIDIKAEFRDLIKEQLLAQTIQSKITKDIAASPSDVRTYFESIAKDSIPYINSELEVAQIVRYPLVSEDAKKSIREQLEGIKKKIQDGTSFAAMAGLYSQDPVSAKKGGELGFVNRTDLVPEFAAVAFSLKGNEISKVFESKYGFHIVQLIERRGTQVNVRHILLKPEVVSENLSASNNFLDSISTLIHSGKFTFQEAAQKFSDDLETRNNGGLLINATTGNTRFEPDQLDQSVFFIVDKLKTGEFSEPKFFKSMDGKEGYRLLLLKTRTEPHQANLQDDYQKIQNATLNEKQNKALTDWVIKKKNTTYIHIEEDYKHCDVLKNWFE